MKPADEKWVQLVRQQDKRGVPLLLRETTNALALDQTKNLQVHRTRSYHSLGEPNPRPGRDQCQRCGATLPERDREGWRIKRSIWLADGRVDFWLCAGC